jgi:hypothetical protein
MVLRHGRRYDERARGIDVRRIVSRDAEAQPLEVARTLGVGVAPCDGDAAPKKELGERTHAGSGNTYEMNWSGVA